MIIIVAVRRLLLPFMFPPPPLGVLQFVYRFPLSLTYTLRQQLHRLLIRSFIKRRHLLTRNLLDALDELDIILRDERDALPCAAPTRRMSHSMVIILRMLRDVEIDNNVDERDV